MMRRLLLVCALMMVCALGLSAQDELPLYNLPSGVTYKAFSSNSLVALSGARVATVNMLTDSVTLTDVRLNEVIAEIAVGDDPRSIDVTPDGTRLLVTNHGDESLIVIDIEGESVIATYIVGDSPYAVITDNNETAFVSLQGGDAVVEIDLATGRILQEIPTPSTPTGLAIWGDFLYVTHFHTGQISLIYLPVGDVVRTISTGQNSGLSPFIYVDSANGLAYVPQSVTYPDSDTPTFDRTIRPRVIVIDLAQMRVLRDRTLWLDIVDQPVNIPFSVALNVAQRRLFVLHAGSNNLSTIDLNTGLSIWNTALPDNPRGIVLATDSSALYINNAVDTSLSILDTRFYMVEDTIPTSTNLPNLETRLGAELFYSATDTRVSGTPYLSCASCHFDGASDGRNWFGVMTPLLDNILTDFELNVHITTMTYGKGFDAGADFEAEALISYMQSLNRND